jgi:hypothetical protein
MTADFTEIIRLAALENKVDKLTTAQRADYGRDLAALGSSNCGLVLLAAKLMAGRPLEIEMMIGNNPKEAEEAAETFGRLRALADHLGGTVEEAVVGPFSTSWVFFPHPPARQ